MTFDQLNHFKDGIWFLPTMQHLYVFQAPSMERLEKWTAAVVRDDVIVGLAEDETHPSLVGFGHIRESWRKIIRDCRCGLGIDYLPRLRDALAKRC